MKKIVSICLWATMCVLGLQAQSIYDFKVKDGQGADVSLDSYRGKVLLIVNTATRCGFTPQYKELEAIYEKYRGEGLEILDFPCNQFGAQAPGSIEEIHQFCTENFDIQFAQFDKIDVNGADEHPLYTFLKAEKGFAGFNLDDRTGRMLDQMFSKQDPDYAGKPDIKWNFTKFLVSRDGRVVARYEPSEPMDAVEGGVQMELNPVVSAIEGRRSVRKYLDKPVEHDKLALLARCGILAPSAMNRQPWAVRVVEDRQLIDQVSDVYRKAHPEEVARDADFKNLFRNAPNIICIGTPAKGGGELDAGLLGENIMLAAQSLGLGTCCLGGPVRYLNQEPEAKFFLDRINLPDDYRLTYIIAVGYPDEQPAARPREEGKVEFIR